MQFYCMLPNNDYLLPVYVPVKYETGHGITLTQARQELLKNLNNSDRLSKSSNWTREKQHYFKTCYDIVQQYRKASEKGLVDKKPLSNRK